MVDGRKRGADPANMKERHRDQANVLGRPLAPACLVRLGDAHTVEVVMAEQGPLGAAGCSRCVELDRYITPSDASALATRIARARGSSKLIPSPSKAMATRSGMASLCARRMSPSVGGFGLPSRTIWPDTVSAPPSVSSAPCR